LERNKVICMLFAVKVIKEDVYVYACVSVSQSVAVINNQETEAGV
jgi:ArsR family metal-binding transcriptional regulator